MPHVPAQSRVFRKPATHFTVPKSERIGGPPEVTTSGSPFLQCLNLRVLHFGASASEYLASGSSTLRTLMVLLIASGTPLPRPRASVSVDAFSGRVGGFFGSVRRFACGLGADVVLTFCNE